MEAIMMKIFIHRILIAVVCLSTLFLGCIEEENHKIELPIDTPEEAIEYAKTDNTTKEWIGTCPFSTISYYKKSFENACIIKTYIYYKIN